MPDTQLTAQRTALASQLPVEPKNLAARELWHSYHNHVLPVAVGLFFLTFSGWSLLGVENLAVQKQR